MASLCRLTSRLSVIGRTVLFNGARSASGGSTPTKESGSSYVYDTIDAEKRVNIEAFNQELAGAQQQEPSREEIYDVLGHTVGDQRYEMLEKLRGVSDPFDVAVQKESAGKGTRANPVLVPSVSGVRLVGCVCEEDSCSIQWMTLYSGEKRRCNCEKWFQLVDIQGHAEGH